MSGSFRLTRGAAWCKMGSMEKTGMVFGVFDGLHEGHKYFLTQAAEQCDELFVVVATDEVVEKFKEHPPRQRYEERVRILTEFKPGFKILPSDAVVGSWEVLERIRSDIIFLGYDQQGTAEELRRRGVPFSFLEAHHPERYKSSLLHGKN